MLFYYLNGTVTALEAGLAVVDCGGVGYACYTTSYTQSQLREATRQEIAELSRQLAGFGLSLGDIADNCPRQARTLTACQRALRYAKEDPAIIPELLRTHRLPMAKLAAGSGVERKTLERHRRYLMALLLIYSNGYEIIRGHLAQLRTPSKGGGPA